MIEKPTNIFVVGGSGHARVVVDALHVQGLRVAGIVDPNFEVGTRIEDVAVLGGDEIIEELRSGEVDLVNGVGALPGSLSRWRIAKSLRERGFEWKTVVHPTAIKSVNFREESGVQIMAGAVLQSGVKIGRDSVINTRATIDHDCVIGNECWISPGAILCGGVQLGCRTYVGAGAVIIQNVTIGNGVLVKAGSLICDDIQDMEYVSSE